MAFYAWFGGNLMSHVRFSRAVKALLCLSAVAMPSAALRSQTVDPMPLVYLNQGTSWNASTREDFYWQDQGSQLIPYSWLQGLTTPDGKPFLTDKLQRYGYLADRSGTPGDLPIGFTLTGTTGNEVVGMNCAACHTREIDVSGTSYRVDGGPALTDFQGLLTDMIDAVGRVLQSDASFAPFAVSVLGPNPDPVSVSELKATVQLWYTREDALRDRAYPTANIWGLGRLDAVSMIFNRLTGLDIGKPPTYLIPNNIQLADAPVRYPFLWNAAKQDMTQWPGFADNGNDLLGLARNLGEVYGVFATFHPVNKGKGRVDFLANNSANFSGLGKLEGSIKLIGAPAWPWPIDQKLAARGQQVWAMSTPDSPSCGSCHDQKAGKIRFPNFSTWATPIQNVGTDTREWDILARTADSGSLAGGKLFPPFGTPIPQKTTSFSLLGFAVVGSILQNADPFKASLAETGTLKSNAKLPKSLEEITGAFGGKSTTEAASAAAVAPGSYESRVMYGIWAAAPYLHNGSVPTLADLLKPAAERPASFKMGRAYDVTRVGIASQQAGNHVVTTTGCDQLNSGNSRCGHEFGTKFSAEDKAALLEYLKML